MIGLPVGEGTMEIRDACFAMSVKDGTLIVRRRKTGEALPLAWPAVRVAIGGRTVIPVRPAGPPTASRLGISQVFLCGGMRFTVSVRLSGASWWRKRVDVSAGGLPTPDYLEMDRQVLPDEGLAVRGYRPTDSAVGVRRDEEGAGGMPGCGYPLIGRRFFAGLEHPAGFNTVSARGGAREMRLRHFPVWSGSRLDRVDEVFGWSDDAAAAFAAYLDSIRLPVLRAPLVTFGTFWSDPYLGNLEYDATLESHAAYIEAFAALGLKPDAYTLDAGWNDRASFLAAKPAMGGDAGLSRLRRLAEKHGGGLSLWISHNGSIGIHCDFLRRQGIEVGGGAGATYTGDGFGVMMDGRLEARLAARLAELASKVGVRHFKADWDNECASSPRFARIYPTRNHVRQASCNAFFRIARAARAAGPGLVLRSNGWWPSPWWLREGNHVWLADSGDSEFSSLPSRTRRDAATTHRDLMYHAILRRDATPLPLDCFDNHEFPDSLRNPFGDGRATWTDAVWLSFLRGSTYIAYTLMPENLDGYKAEVLRRVMEFCRANARRIYVRHGRMVLGDPALGEVYGFLQPGGAQSWCVLRNPLPIPQKASFDPAAMAGHPVRSVRQFYPFHDVLKPAGGMILLAHEVKILILGSRDAGLPHGLPHMVEETEDGAAYRYPSSAAVSRSIGPAVHPIQRIEALRCLDSGSAAIPGGKRYQWFVSSPYRMRGLEVQFRLEGPGAGSADVRAFSSRYNGAGASGCAIPITHIPSGVPGYGERKNAPAAKGPTTRYFAFRAPAGGEANIALEVVSAPRRPVVLTAWLAGYEAPSRGAEIRARGPAGFHGRIPCQHPLGFARALALPVR